MGEGVRTPQSREGVGVGASLVLLGFQGCMHPLAEQMLTVTRNTTRPKQW